MVKFFFWVVLVLYFIDLVKWYFEGLIKGYSNFFLRRFVGIWYYDICSYICLGFFGEGIGMFDNFIYVFRCWSLWILKN